MEITDALLLQWEPKIQKFLQTTFVLGMDREDIAQELRIAVMKAASNFDEDRGVIFHTYLHTVMVNTLRTLISKAQKNKSIYEAYSIDNKNSDLNGVVKNMDLKDTITSNFMIDLEIKDILKRAKLNSNEKDFIELRTDGLTMEQISLRLGESAYKIRTSLQQKIRMSGYIKDLYNETKG